MHNQTPDYNAIVQFNGFFEAYGFRLNDPGGKIKAGSLLIQEFTMAENKIR